MQEFSILDSPGMKTISFIIENDFIEAKEVFTLKMLDNQENIEDEKTRKTFFVETEENMAVTILMLTVGNNKVIMNSAILENDEINIVKKPDIVKYEPVTNSEGIIEFRDFKYTPNLKRPISIIDTQTCQEIKPALYIDSQTGDILGRCKMMPYRAYIAIELIN